VRFPPETFLFPILLSLPGCGGEGAKPVSEIPSERPVVESGFQDLPITITDVSGNTLVLNAPPRRILSLVPSASETLLRLGALDRMVGRTEFDTASGLRFLPSVGGGLHPNMEAVLALEPDLVIRFGGDSDPATPRQLDRMGIPYLTIRPDGIRDIRRIIQDLGTLTGRPGKADTLLTRMDTALAEIRDRVRDRPRRRVAYLLGGSPPWVAGGGSYIEELLEVAGGENVFSDLDGPFGPVNVEVFLVRDMDVILAAEDAEVSIPETDVPLRRVSSSIEIPGPHLAAAALELARVLHPEVFR